MRFVGDNDCGNDSVDDDDDDDVRALKQPGEIPGAVVLMKRGRNRSSQARQGGGRGGGTSRERAADRRDERMNKR